MKWAIACSQVEIFELFAFLIKNLKNSKASIGIQPIYYLYSV